MREGDRNTSYFHRVANSRQASNHIHYLLSHSGQKVESQAEIQDICVDFFSQLLGSEESPINFWEQDLDQLLNIKCSDEQKQQFDTPFSVTEIKNCFLSLPRNKCSVPDGYTAEFFSSCWEIIGGECVVALLEFFNSGILLKQWNATAIDLIPKRTNADKISEFRPIALLNTI